MCAKKKAHCESAVWYVYQSVAALPLSCACVRQSKRRTVGVLSLLVLRRNLTRGWPARLEHQIELSHVLHPPPLLYYYRFPINIERIYNAGDVFVCVLRRQL